MDSSSANLRSVVIASVKQQELLSKNLNVSSQQLTIIKDQQRVLSLKPKLEFFINEILEKDCIEKGIILNAKDASSQEYAGYNTFTISVKLKNIGGAVAINPLIVLGAGPAEVLFRTGNDPQYLNTNIASYNKNGTELPIFEDYKTYIHEYVKVSVPTNQSWFFIGFKSTSYKFPTRIIVVKFTIISN